MLSWKAIGDIVRSGKVDFGFKINPDDRRQLERLYHKVRERTRVRAISYKHIEVAHRGTDPKRNAALVNELVKRFIGEDRRESQQRVRTDLKYYRDKLAQAKAGLADVDKRSRELRQAFPLLPDTVDELEKQSAEAQQREDEIRSKHAECRDALVALRRELRDQNPKDRRFEELTSKVAATERTLKRLKERKLAANRRVATFYVMRRKAPELLAQKRRLHDARAQAAERVARFAKAAQAADEQLQRLRTEAYSTRFTVLEYARDDRTSVRRAEPPQEPVLVESLQRGQIKFAQIDSEGAVTIVTHFFRELPPEPQKRFTIHPRDADSGTVALFRLRNLATGEVLESRDVPARRTAGGAWAITDEGWRRIRDRLQARMRVQLTQPILTR